MHPFFDLSPDLGDAILSLQPTAYWPLDDGSGPLRSLAQNWPATVTGSPTYGVAAPSPIGRGVTFSGTGQYATTSGSVPTPTTSMSALALINTTNAAGSSRVFLCRVGASQASWRLIIGASEYISFSTMQSGGSLHATQAVAGAANTGAWVLAGGTFDGTTLRVYVGRAAGVSTNSTTTFSGTWHNASTAGIGIAHQNTAGLFPGSVAHPAYWADRVLTAAEFAYINRIVQGV